MAGYKRKSIMMNLRMPRAQPQDPPDSALQRSLRDAGHRRKLTSEVARQLVAYIVESGMPAGSTLPHERTMLDQLGVSRGTLREALRILETHGLISLKPGPSGGPIVEAMSASQLGMASTLHFYVAGATFGELWDARLRIEPMMARIAAERRPPEVLGRLREAMARARAAEDSDYYLQATSAFHTILSGATGNRVLDLYANAFAAVWDDHVSDLAFPEGDRAQVFDDHDAIAEAVIAGDGERAEALMQAHLRTVVSYVSARDPGVLEQVIPFAL